MPGTEIYPKAAKKSADSAGVETGQMKWCTHGTKYAQACLDHIVCGESVPITALSFCQKQLNTSVSLEFTICTLCFLSCKLRAVSCYTELYNTFLRIRTSAPQ